MDIEKCLIRTAIDSAEMTKILASGISPKHFDNLKDKQHFEYIHQEYMDNGSSPTIEMLEHIFPNYKEADIDGVNTPFLIEQFKEQKRKSNLLEMLGSTKEFMDDPDEAYKHLHSQLNDSATFFATSEDTVLRGNAVDDVMALAKETLLKGGLTGIQTPFPSLTKAIGGFNDEEFIVISARPKTGKTWFLLMCASHAVKAGHKVLFFSKEMSKKYIQRRYIALRAKIEYNHLKSGQLDGREILRLKKTKKEMDAEKGEFIIVEDDTSDDTGVSFVDAKIEEYKPDMAMVDGAYLLADDNGATDERPRLRNISRDMKRCSRRRKLPLVIVSQVTRGKEDKKTGSAGLSGLYGTDGFAQDADVVLELIKTEDLEAEGARELKVVASREGEDLFIKFLFDLNTYNFSVLQSDSAEDYEDESNQHVGY